MSLKNKQAIGRIAAFILVLSLSVAIFLLPEDQSDQLESFGLLGIFVISIMANATLFLPAPGLLVVFTMGARLHPLGVALAAASGATIGELSGYLAGFSGQGVIENASMYERMVRWMKKNGSFTVLILAFFPNPFFDLTGMAAGALKMPLIQFIAWCWTGKFGKMLVVAFAGAGFISIPWISNMIAN